LALANRTLLANTKELENKTIEAEFETAIKEDSENDESSDWYRLKTILKEKGYSKKKKKKIMSQVKEFVGVDEDVSEEDGDIYIKGNKNIKEMIKG
ncbi:MAG: hypothetical protein ACK5LP_07435, partial [Campylobacteraceae bacterium]